jgi:hypothetical protein
MRINESWENRLRPRTDHTRVLEELCGLDFDLHRFLDSHVNDEEARSFGNGEDGVRHKGGCLRVENASGVNLNWMVGQVSLSLLSNIRQAKTITIVFSKTA